MSTKSARAAIADTCADVLTGWTVHAQPPEVISAPALVVGPRDPYITRSTARLWTLHLRLSFMVPRAAGAIALDLLDDAIDLIRPVILSVPTVRWAQVGGLGVVAEGDVRYLLAAVDIESDYDPVEA